jgi:hypothetical protein
METKDDRLVPRDMTSDLLSMAMMIYGLPRVPEKADALVVFHGLGESWRTVHAIKWWQEKGCSARFLLVAGSNKDETTSEILTIECLSGPPFNLQRIEGVYSQIQAKNTKIQSDWVYERIVEFEVTSLALFVSSYHLLRAYLTLLKTFLLKGVSIPIIPVPTPISPNSIVPEVGVDFWSLIPGDVAVIEELINYIQWVWQQPIFSEYF